MIFFLTVTVASLIFIKNYLSTENPEVSTNSEFNSNFPRIDLEEAMMSPVIAVLLQERHFLNLSEFSKFFTIQAFIFENTYDEADIENFDFKIKPIAMIPFKPCSQVISNATKWYLKSNSSNAKNIGEIHSLCPEVANMSDYYIKGDVIYPPIRLFMINILPCSLEDSTKCGKIENLVELSIYAFLPKIGFNKQNFQNPITMSPTVGFSFPINYQMAKKRKIFFKESRIYDDRMDFFPTKEKARFVEVDYADEYTYPRPGTPLHCTAEEVMTFTCMPYVQLEYRPSGKIVKITRSYKKLLNVFGEIGGTSKSFFLVASILLYLLGRFLFKKKRMKKILEVELEEAKKFLNEEEENFDNNQFEKVLGEFEMNSHDGYRLLKTVNKFRIIDKVFFKPHHRKLIPLLLLRDTMKGMNIDVDDEEELSTLEAVDLLVNENYEDAVDEKMSKFFLENLPDRLKKERGREVMKLKKFAKGEKEGEERRGKRDKKRRKRKKRGKSDGAALRKRKQLWEDFDEEEGNEEPLEISRGKGKRDEWTFDKKKVKSVIVKKKILG